ncbi:MAG TPA: V-type ATP synthase subunit D [Gammaproteobacteria bacterium]|nr:V-type ATP synthase subunit D [Gammaproteobacteria bacterium]
MTVALSKSSLQHQRERLRLLERYLPSLDLKRQQLTVEYRNAERVLAEAEAGAATASRSLGALLPILGAARIKLSGLVRIRSIDVAEEHVLGLRLPALHDVQFAVSPYSLLATPVWFDDLVTCLEEVATYRLRLQIYRERVARLAAGVRRVTQRVNLFDKVLIPNARRDIARIRIFLSDLDRAGVVTSKMAKAKQARQARPASAEARP